MLPLLGIAAVGAAFLAVQRKGARAAAVQDDPADAGDPLESVQFAGRKPGFSFGAGGVPLTSDGGSAVVDPKASLGGTGGDVTPSAGGELPLTSTGEVIGFEGRPVGSGPIGTPVTVRSGSSFVLAKYGTTSGLTRFDQSRAIEEIGALEGAVW